MLDLGREVWMVLRETDGYAEAVQYAGDVVEDMQAEGQEVTEEMVVAEIRRQLGMPPLEGQREDECPNC